MTEMENQKLTPMMEQYFKVKEQHPDCVLFYRLGDFYEMFGEDAKIASSVLDLTLTSRNKNSDNPLAMCGFPYHSMKPYLAKMVKAGYQVAICDQMSDPSLPGIVERQVTQVVTAGTALDEMLLDQKKNNYLLALKKQGDSWVLASLDSSTGDFKVCEANNIYDLESELYRLQAVEILISENDWLELEKYSWMKQYRWQKYALPKWVKARDLILNQFKVSSLAAFGLAEDNKILLETIATILQYVKDKQMADAYHLNKIRYYYLRDFLILDNASLYNLEIFNNSFNGKVDGSLWSVLDFTVTPMGARLLQTYLARPLRDRAAIEARLDAVAEIKEKKLLRGALRSQLKDLYDLARLAGRVGAGRANPKDLIQIKNILEVLPEIKKNLQQLNSHLWKNIFDNCLEIKDLLALLQKSLSDEPSATLNEGNIIRDGYHVEVDELRKIMYSGKDYLRELQEKEIKRSGINSLKVKFNKVFGYYIEISKANLDAVPTDYIRKQTLVNAERFITPELKEFEEKVLGAEEKLFALEQNLYLEILRQAQAYVQDLQTLGDALGRADVFSALAELAEQYRYVRPKINDEGVLTVKNGRHPVIERYLQKAYIPNDINLNSQAEQLHIITGPNMSGKSSYLRMSALLSILAHLGSFVPAEEANICLLDKIFTRVGASDNVSFGKSTFMVEMEETANILNNATAQSLIILDELGRGTSTYDGLSIAWAVAEFIHDKIGAKTLFATHYHELLKLEKQMSRVKNYSVAVDESGKEILFLYKIINQGTDRSYGIHVAKLAGLPESVLRRSKEILADLEKMNGKVAVQQLDLFQTTAPASVLPEVNEDETAVLSELKDLNYNSLTPLQVLEIVARWQSKLKK
ncbi:MAG TPA: DNA mismatch repair protein MutS [bacterium]|nr:DNA mismatch repair protein MutS [bacterium]